VQQTQVLTLVDMFQYQGNKLQHVIDEKGEIWFPATDGCKILDIINVSQAVESLGDDEKLLYPLHISGQHRNVWLVNEPGFYHLVFQSRKPEAQQIRHWVYHEVLPTIRKTGSYSLQGLAPLDYLDQVIEKQREILRGYRKVKHQEQKRLGLVAPHKPRQNTLAPQELLLNFLKAQPVPVTVREITQYAPLSVRQLKADGIRTLLIEMQAADLVTIEIQGKTTNYCAKGGDERP